jgi:hypothetical protein
MYMVAGLNMVKKKTINFQDNPIYKLMLESASVNTITSLKI